MGQFCVVIRVSKFNMVALQYFLQGRRILSLRNIFPDDPLKKWMLFKLFEWNSFFRISLKKFNQDVTKIVTYFTNDCIKHFFDVYRFYVILDLIIRLVFSPFEQVLLKFQLIHQNSNRPNIRLLTIMASYCLRSCVLESAYKCGKGIFLFEEHPR